MSDLISRKALQNEFAHKCRGVCDMCQYDMYGLCKLIKDAPTVEAKEVVHGEWINNEYYTWECGNCGFHPFKGYIPKEPGFNYCPNCGADMRTSAE